MGDGIGRLAGGLRTVVVRLNHSFRQPVSHYGVTPTRLAAMSVLAKCGPMRSGDLAERLSVTPPSMSRLVEALQEGGWLDRGPDPQDRRAHLLTISDQGHTMLETLRRESTGALADAIRALPDTDRRALADALPVLVRLSDHLLDSHRPDTEARQTT